MIKIHFVVILVIFLPTAVFAGPPQPAADPAGIRELQDEPEDFVGRRVEVTGRLETKGRNYFRNPEFVLTDARGAEIEVDPWLPLETPPAPPGRRLGRRPSTMSDLVGKTVKVSGELAPAPDEPDLSLLGNLGRAAPARNGSGRYTLKPTTWRVLP